MCCINAMKARPHELAVVAQHVSTFGNRRTVRPNESCVVVIGADHHEPMPRICIGNRHSVVYDPVPNKRGLYARVPTAATAAWTEPYPCRGFSLPIALVLGSIGIDG